MTTVGIITMHTPLNYGSYLQTYATYMFLKENGYSPTIINYKYPTNYHKQLAQNNNAPQIRHSFIYNKISGLCRRLLKVNSDGLRKKMQSFYLQNLTFTKEYNSAEELKKDPPLFDIYLSGSDQIWNPQYIGKDTTCVLSWVPEGRKKIAFSSSFALTELPSEYYSLYKESLEKYQSISIREFSNIPQHLLGHNVPVTIDPTLLFPKNKWKQLVKSTPIVKGKYVLCYLLGYKFNPNPYALKLAKHIANKIGAKVVAIGGDPINVLKGIKVIPNCGPEEFLNLFYYSEFVITSSFHGTIFALNFEKPLLSIVNDTSTKDNRQISFLNRLGLKEQCVIKNTPFDNISMPVIKKEAIDKLDSLREMSVTYFLNALSL